MSRPRRRRSAVEWNEHPGRGVWVHAPKRSYADGRAAEELRAAERAIPVLETMLDPPADRRGRRVDVYLVDPVAEPPAGMDLPATSESDAVGEGGIVRVLQADAEAPPIVWPLTRLLVLRWFGEGASEAGPVLDGLAGVVAARTGAGPSLEDASAWVRERTTSGLPFSLSAAPEDLGDLGDDDEPDGPGLGEMEAGPPPPPGPGMPPPGGEMEPPPGAGGFREVEVGAEGMAMGAGIELPPDPAGTRMAATAFVAHLIDRYGIEALRRFLSGYDPGRRDRAANEAFHEPLADIEKAWRGSFEREVGRRPVRSFLRYLGPLFRPYRARQAEVLLYMFVGSAFGVLSLPVATGAVIGALGDVDAPGASSGLIARLMGAVQRWLESGDTFSRLVLFLLLLLLIFGLEALINMRRDVVSEGISQRLLMDLQVRVFDHLQRLPHSFYADANVGDLMSRLSGDLTTVSMAMTQVLNIGLFTVVGLIVAAFGVFALSVQLGLVVLVVAPLFYLIYRFLGSRLSDVSYERMVRMGAAASVTQENLSAHAVIKAYGLEDRSQRSYRARLDNVLRSALRMARISSLYEASTDVAITIAQLLVIGYGGYLVLNGDLPLGILVAFIGILPSLLAPLSQFADIGEIVQEASGSLARVTELLDQPIPIADRPGATSLPRADGNVRFEGVTFGYDGSIPILQDFDLDIPAGANVAVVGPSGSGKSTIINLLMRFWDPQQGRVSIDGHDIREVTLASLRSQMGLVFQETFAFDTTVRENIAIGRPDASDEEIAAAARGAQLDSFIEALPEGYDTVLGERGVRMSGGQRQRMAIARVLLRDPRIMILDEATSALDAETEAGILQTLSEVAKGRTTISITHRLTTAAGADRIYVLDGGRLVEEGTHAELLRAGGLYAQLYQTQVRFTGGGGSAAGAEGSALASIALFSELPPDALDAIAEHLRLERYAAGQDVVRQDERGERFYMVKDGELEVSVAGDGGERRVAALRSGDFFGELALLRGGARTATVRTVSPSELYSLSLAEFRELGKKHRKLKRAIEKEASARSEALASAAEAAGVVAR